MAADENILGAMLLQLGDQKEDVGPSGLSDAGRFRGGGSFVAAR